MNVLILVMVMVVGMAYSQEPVDVYILSGQSNMQGIGQLKNLPKEQKKAYPNVRYWNGKAFVKLIPGVTKTSSRKGEFGPEIGFINVLAEKHPNRKIYIIKHHASGQPLHWGWNQNTWVGGKPSPKRMNFYPGETADDPNIGGHYKRLKSIFTKALGALKDEGTPYTIKGILWMQGEQDSKNEKSATEYAHCLKRLYDQLQVDLKVKAVPFIFGQVLPHEPALDRFTHRKELRQSMANAQQDSGHKNAIKNVWMVPTEGMPLKKDTVHYNAKGQFMLGTAMGKAMLNAQM